jgi:hypothetical protein
MEDEEVERRWRRRRRSKRKKKWDAPPPLCVPVLDRASVVARAFGHVKDLGARGPRKPRHERALPVWKQSGRVHALRGVYTCMALRLFDWQASDAHVAMSILGHAGLHESLVYTTFSLGASFADEQRLGDGPVVKDDAPS